MNYPRYMPGEPPPSASIPPPGAPAPAPGANVPAPQHPAGIRRPRTLVAAAGAVVALAAVAYVAFGSSSNGTVDPVAAAAIRSSDAPGFRERLAINMTTSSGGSFSETGAATVDPSVPAVNMRLAMVFPDSPQITQELGSDTLSMSVVLVRDTMYARFPSSVMSQLSTLGKSWVSVNFGKLINVPDASSLINSPSSNPSEMLDFLRAVSGSIFAAGHEIVDHVPTTEYQGTVDLNRVAALLPGAQQSVVEQEVATLEREGVPTSYPVDVWVDAHGLVRKYSMSLDMTNVDGQTADMTVTTNIFDYGRQPTIAPPPSGDVASLS